MRAIRPGFAACLLLVPIAASGQRPAAVGGTGNGTTFTNSTLLVQAIQNVSNTVRVDTFLTRLTARIATGPLLYDQSFNAQLSDPAVQVAMQQAKNVLAGAGAPLVSGPSLVSSNVTQVSSVPNTVDTVSYTNVTTTVNTYIGPQTIMIGDQQRTPFVIPAGGMDIDTLVTTHQGIVRTTTTTNTFRTANVYEINGAPSPPATPAPPSLILGLTGLAGTGLYLVKRRFASWRAQDG